MPVVAIARTGEILRLPLADLPVEGRSAAVGTLRVTARPTSLGRADAFRLAVEGEASAPAWPQFQAGGVAPVPREATLAVLHPPYYPDDHLRIEDARGRAFGLAISTRPANPPTAALEYEVRLYPSAPDMGAPTTLRYFGTAAVAVEVPFDFRDIVIP